MGILRVCDADLTGITAVMGVDLVATGSGGPTPPPAEGEAKGIFAGGYTVAGGNGRINIDQVDIQTLGNTTDFGDLLAANAAMGAASNGANNRGIFAGGNPGPSNVIQYITINSPGNAQDFGDLTDGFWAGCGTSNNTNERAVFTGGFDDNRIDYVTINSAGNASDFGDIPWDYGIIYNAATSNGTSQRGVFGGGEDWDSGDPMNVINYITISTTGNAAYFGDLLEARTYTGACSNLTGNRGIFSLSGYSPPSNVLCYITINSAGNASDFGDLTNTDRNNRVGTNSSTRGVFAGGSGWDGDVTYTNDIEYITIATTGNAANFGDLLDPLWGCGACSNA